VRGQLVQVTSTTTIRFRSQPAVFADLGVSDLVHVKASRTTLAADAVLEAVEIMLQNPAGEGGEESDDPSLSNLVSVSAFDASASETGANPGTFRLTRAGAAGLLASPLTVTFTLTGTAGNGTDYTLLPLTATFLASQTTVDVVVTPLADGLAEGPETVILTLTGVAPYELGSPLSATITITDAANPLVTVAAVDASASEAGDTGRFVLTRSGDLTAPLTVTVVYTGSAVNGTDYEALPATVTFAAGQASVNVFVIPIADTVTDPSETVILTVVDGVDYDLGTPATATVTITGT